MKVTVKLCAFLQSQAEAADYCQTLNKTAHKKEFPLITHKKERLSSNSGRTLSQVLRVMEPGAERA